MELSVRSATPHDIPALSALVDEAVRGLGRRDYGPQQIESALRYVFGIDTLLIADGTYYVAEADGQLAGAGGWSRRATLYRGDQAGGGDARLLDPAREPARIRAFYVHPDWARRGIGRMLIERCEEAARAAGYAQLELVATLTGVPLYKAAGFIAAAPVDVPMPNGVTLPCVHMSKAIHRLLAELGERAEGIYDL